MGKTPTVFIFWLFLLGSGQTLFAQNDAEAEIDEKIAARRAAINQMISYELRVATLLIKLDEKQKDVLAGKLQPIVDSQSRVERNTSQLRSRVQTSLATSIQSLLGEELSQQYDADRRARKRFHSEAYIQSAIVVVDEMVALTHSQRDRMADVFGALYLLGPQTPDYFFFDYDLGVPKGDAGEAVKKILSKSQYELWDKSISTGDIRMDTETTAKREKAIRAAGELRAAWLIDALELTEAQQKRLRLVRKATVQPTLKLLEETIALRGENAYLSEVGSESPGGLVISHSRWSRLARMVMTDKQKELYAQLLRDRARRVHEATMYVICEALSHQHALTASQLQSLHKTLCDSTPINLSAKRVDAKRLRGLVKTPRIQLIGAVGEAAVPAIDVLFQGIRGSLAEMAADPTTP